MVWVGKGYVVLGVLVLEGLVLGVVEGCIVVMSMGWCINLITHHFYFLPPLSPAQLTSIDQGLF